MLAVWGSIARDSTDTASIAPRLLGTPTHPPCSLPPRSFPYNASQPDGPTMGEEVLVFRGFGTEVRLFNLYKALAALEGQLPRAACLPFPAACAC